MMVFMINPGTGQVRSCPWFGTLGGSILLDHRYVSSWGEQKTVWEGKEWGVQGQDHGNGTLFVEAGNCAGLLEISKKERVEKGSKINHETALMNSEEWVAAVSANFIISFPSGTFKDTEQITSSRASHTLPGGVPKLVTTHTPAPHLFLSLPAYTLRFTDY